MVGSLAVQRRELTVHGCLSLSVVVPGRPQEQATGTVAREVVPAWSRHRLIDQACAVRSANVGAVNGDSADN